MARKIPQQVLARARQLAIDARPGAQAGTNALSPAPTQSTRPLVEKARPSRNTREKVVAALRRLHPMD